MKRNFYILMTIVLMLELSFLAHSLIERYYIDLVLEKGETLNNTFFFGFLYCVLPWWVQYSLLILAVTGGYFLGKFWWRIVYIEKRHSFLLSSRTKRSEDPGSTS
ncbi:hypothetical protein A2331_04825 [Candidatus Falkowbacteria bacterium RIFOXYB2_FULL_34_18]|uniref:Uncharacterized protein n=1 Tax=Candidatus Falkowbacteria bacterium RIFOXYD2_FULL_34_120 TaxID=1798007 RepID=A0A1F5TNS2_9BACT|nr:MAG: hypothetical protein A2331_04825 [Candidatus Falkowbacteria bacterium RIFOXYB2_FULL_34_18]OGF28856.1 MAG: hypothetical protein A2500_00550 [Candidatus Falkowbacteria bacterium RIFOXYC12_FULL_34_55]OGF35771.1 MAG: hypothetical protein A2466_04520 [Candidatus Falkowbacteria bacterium RIFOXYC2_FULL_34_220]OGF38437.1 MAG: hypothetical protein A2515_01960 [Candidatus Falkowbacteria bacterium RIFOXYD12_FULL_34_57]OGF40507.1 MAG: hypothetical protein A2531_02965 [Candidatus Falkowbacteria bact